MGLPQGPVLGADFLCLHRLLVDVAHRWLIDVVSFYMYSRTRGRVVRWPLLTSGLPGTYISQ